MYKRDIFQFDVNFTLLLVHSFLHLSLCFIDRRSTPHNISLLRKKYFKKRSFHQGIVFPKKSNMWFSSHHRRKKERCILQACHRVSFCICQDRCQKGNMRFFNFLLNSFSWTNFVKEVMAHVCLGNLV